MKPILIIILFILFCKIVLSQDIHFSQFYTVPMTLNPALTAYMNNNMRVGINYKSQWESFTTPYETKLVSLDLKYRPKQRGLNWFGFGGIVFMDEAGSGVLRNSQASASLAYHKILGLKKKIHMSVGFTGSFGQKSINYHLLSFGNQWNGTEFYPFISSGENISVDSFSYFDMATGLIFSTRFKKITNLYTGISFYHLAKPKNSFYEEVNQKFVRSTFHAGANIKLNESFFLEPAIYFSRQKSANEIIIGSNIMLYANNTSWILGSWFRLSGDIIPTVGFDIFDIRILTGYDINISKLKYATKARGGAEISIVYHKSLQYHKRIKRQRAVNCPAWSKNGLMMDN